MNKRAAQELSRSGTLSIGELRKKITDARGKRSFSVVNPAIPHEQVLSIYESALEGRDDSEVPAGMRPDIYSNVGAMKPTKDALIIQNILRDCA